MSHRYSQSAGQPSDSRVGDVFTSDFIAELARVTGEHFDQIESYHLSQLPGWRHHYALQQYYSSEIFMLSVRRTLERYMIKSIKQSIAQLRVWMSKGGSLLGPPEGYLSPDGTISPINSGLHRLLRQIPSDTRIAPISIMYDFMTVGRMRIFIDFAPPIENAPRLPVGVLDSRLRQAWLHSARFTSTQLASGFLVNARREGVTSFTLDDVADYLYQQAPRLTKAGCNVDHSLLTHHRTCKRAAGFLAFARRHSLIRQIENCTWELTFDETAIQVRPREVGYDQSPLIYAWNELQEMLTIV